MPTQDELIRMLTLGQLGPWGGQGFVPGGITVLRPDTMQWETILATPGDADLMTSTLGSTVAMGTTLEFANEDDIAASGYQEGGGNVAVTGLEISVGLPSSLGAGGGAGSMMMSAIPASQYTWQNFTETELGVIRMTQGMSNGETGPLSPISVGTGARVVMQTGELWFPVIRIDGIDTSDAGSSNNTGGSW